MAFGDSVAAYFVKQREKRSMTKFKNELKGPRVSKELRTNVSEGFNKFSNARIPYVAPRGIQRTIHRAVSRQKGGTGIIKQRTTKYGSKIYGVGGVQIRSSKKRLSQNRVTTRGQTTGKVGRPVGTLKVRINPFTGKQIKIPAKEYYKLVKEYKNQSQGISQNVDTQQVRELAKRGIPPEQARVLVNARQIREAVPQYQPQQQVQQIQQVQPQAYQAEYQRIQQLEPWVRRSAEQQLRRRIQIDQRLQNEGRTRLLTPPQPQRVEVNLMTGRPMLNQNSFQRRERWTN